MRGTGIAVYRCIHRQVTAAELTFISNDLRQILFTAATSKAVFQANGDGHEARDTRDTSRCDGRRVRWLGGDASAAVGFAGELQLAFDGDHAASSTLPSVSVLMADG